MRRILLRWFILTLAVWLAATVIPGIDYDGWKSLVAAALVLGILNTLVKPALKILSLPFIIVTFGLFLLVINAVLLLLTGWLVPGFSVRGICAAAGGSLVISLVSMVLGTRGTHWHTDLGGRSRGWSRRRGPPPGKGRIIDV